MTAPLRHPFHTIGHSTRTIEEFVAMLRGAEVTMVVDVRTVQNKVDGHTGIHDCQPGLG